MPTWQILLLLLDLHLFRFRPCCGKPLYSCCAPAHYLVILLRRVLRLSLRLVQLHGHWFDATDYQNDIPCLAQRCDCKYAAARPGARGAGTQDGQEFCSGLDLQCTHQTGRARELACWYARQHEISATRMPQCGGRRGAHLSREKGRCDLELLPSRPLESVVSCMQLQHIALLRHV